MTKGDLKAERAKQLEVAHELQEEAKLIAQSQRKKINTFGAVWGENLLTTLLAMRNSPTSGPKPRKRTGAPRKVTFSHVKPKNNKSSMASPDSDISNHSYSDLDEFSAIENEDDTSSIASTIFLGPGTEPYTYRA